MNRHHTILGAAFGLFVAAALVLFQSQSMVPGGGGIAGITVAGAAGTGTSTFDRTIIGIDGTGANATLCFGDTATCIYRGGFAAEDISFFMSGGTRWGFTSGAFMAGSNNANDLGTTAIRWKDIYQAGIHTQTWEDDSGTPGNTTLSQRAGRAAVAIGATTVVITNTTATASDVCLANLRAGTNTVCTMVNSCTAAASSVTIVLNGICATGAGVVEFMLFRGAT